MRLVLQSEQGPRDVVLERDGVDATVGDLLDRLGSAAAGIEVAGRFVARDHSLDEAGLFDGAQITPAEGPSPSAPAHGGPWLCSTGGLDAGRWWPLGPGRSTIGRDPSCDVALDSPTVSGRHAEVLVGAGGQVEVVDLGSHNGTWLDDVPVVAATRLTTGSSIRLGAVTLELVETLPTDQPVGAERHAGPWTFNRPPRPAIPAPPTPLTPPTPARDVAQAPGFGWASLLTPIVMAVAMVLVFDNAMFALFAIISPLTIVGSWWESRRRNRSEQVTEATRVAAERERFQHDLARAAAAERRRREQAAPHLGEVVRRVTAPSVRLWERRGEHGDAFVVGSGTADAAFRPELAGQAVPDDATRELLERHATLPRSPVTLDLAEDGVVGVVGPHEAAVAVARGLVLQLAVHHGPADLELTVFTQEDRRPAWDWAGWLPHARDPRDRDRDRVIADPDLTTPLAEAWLAAGAGNGPTRLVVADAEKLTEGRRAPVRSILNGDAGPVVGIVVAASSDRLPAACRHVVEVQDEDGLAVVRTPGAGLVATDVLSWGVSAATARDAARRMARFEDAELVDPAANLPRGVSLPSLLPADVFTPQTALDAWRAADNDPGLRVPIGTGPDGPLWLDLVADGPHALIGGTTGSGKSELLRSLVAGLAAQVDPDHLNVVLIDYKGGSAFDVCGELPHTVGVVTDLDPHLGARALRCLEAELHHRETVLRAAGATDLPAYLRLPVSRTEPLPRLVVVIDEFATVAAELPDFLEALVGIAQRGRSLGVHLILATQRPSGVVNDNIRANTNLRIALRVQDDADAVDVVGVADPARISRDLPGRAYVRLGPGEVVPVQTAYASGRTSGAGDGLRVRPLHGPPPAGPQAGGALADGRNDLERLVASLAEASRLGGYAQPRTPWPDPLPPDLDLDALAAAASAGEGDATVADRDRQSTPIATVALLDDPDRQRQVPTGWDLAAGNLLLFGIPGSGTTTTLTSLAVALARHHEPDDLHLYALDFGHGELRPLEGLPHVGAVAGAEERERQRRLIAFLRAEVERRRASTGGDVPRIVVLIDGYGAMAAAYDDPADLEVFDALERVIADGVGVGVHVAASAARVGDVPGAVLSAVSQRWVHRLADVYDLSTFGVSPSAVPEMPPGRILLPATGDLAQVARVADVAAEVARIAGDCGETARPPRTLGVLPDLVRPAEVGDLQFRGDVWSVPVGIADDDLGVLRVELHPGEHLLVAGPARSGRSSVLLAVHDLARGAGCRVATIAGRRSPLRVVEADHLEPGQVAAWAQDVSGPALLVVDDAEGLDDPDGTLSRLAKDPESSVRIVAAGRADALRSAYGHWTADVRRPRVGLLLTPDADLDGDLLGTRLPRRSPVPSRPGAGWAVDPRGVRFLQAVQALPDA